MAEFIFLGSKITADGDCSHEIKRRLLLGRKFMTNLDNMLKRRDISLSIKVRLAKAMVFPVVMYGFQLDFLPMNPSILSSISLWPTNTSAMKKFFTSNTSPMHMTHITTHFPIKHPPNKHKKYVWQKSYFDRVNNRGLSPLISRTIGIEPTPKNPKFFVLPITPNSNSKVS